MIEAANRPAKGIFAGVVGIIALMAGAIGVLSELKSALNKIWRTEERGDVKEIVKKNVVFVGMPGGVPDSSLILSAGIAAWESRSADCCSPELLRAADFALSLGIIALMFAATDFTQHENRMARRMVGVCYVTLFNVEAALGLYIGKGAVSSTYGRPEGTGSAAVGLLFGLDLTSTEFTKAYADRLGCAKRSAGQRRNPGHMCDEEVLTTVTARPFRLTCALRPTDARWQPRSAAGRDPAGGSAARRQHNRLVR